MRRKDREIMDVRQMEAILAGARYMHLGMWDAEYPYVVPLHYGYSAENGRLTFFVHCAKEGRKLECIRKNDRVFVEIESGERLIPADTPCGWGAEYASVMCRGRARLVEDAREKRAALRLLMKNQTGKEFAIDEKMAAGVAVIRIDVEEWSAKACVR